MRDSAATAILLAVLLQAAGCGAGQEEAAPPPVQPAAGAEVRDISGLKYFPAVHAALQQAGKSVNVVLFRVRTYTDIKKSPSNILVQDLVDAHKRGVKVAVLLDDSADAADDAGEDKDERNRPVYEALRAAGVDVRLGRPDRKLHAKLVVIDGVLVVEGSANWTYSALAKNAESASMITSERYAAEKTEWIEALRNEAASPRAKGRRHADAGARERK